MLPDDTFSLLTDNRPDIHQTELTGTVYEVRNFWVADDGESGTMLATMMGGKTVRGPVQNEDALAEGLSYVFKGRWFEHDKYGWQFNFQTYQRRLEPNERGVIAYLLKIADGVGKKTATKLWEKYGADAVKVLTNQPELVAADGVMKLEAAQNASASLQTDDAYQTTRIELYDLFAGRGFPAKLIDAAIRKWRTQAPKIIREDPFEMLVEQLPGVGFLRADKLWCELGHPQDHLRRIGMYAWHLTYLETRKGNTWHPWGAIHAKVMETIQGLDEARIGQAIGVMIENGWLYRRSDASGTLWLAERASALAEHRLAQNVVRLLGGQVRWPEVDTAQLVEDQDEILKVILAHPFAMLLGLPGTGKTWLSARIIQSIVKAYGKDAIAVCAPTGKAAVRITTAMRSEGLQIQAMTIHSLLKVMSYSSRGGWVFRHNHANPLPFKYVVVDEVSMLELPIASALLNSCATNTNVLWVGDPHQLPPVGHGAPLRDLVEANVPHGKLTIIKRNDGQIVRSCHQIANGVMFDVNDKVDLASGANLRMIEVGDVSAIPTSISLIYQRWLKRKKLTDDQDIDPVWDVQVLTARNSLRRTLNQSLQQLINPDGERMRGRPFRVGDKVMCLSNGKFDAGERKIRGPNEYYVANGDMGSVEKIEARSMIVRLVAPERCIRVPMAPVGQDEEEAEISTGKDEGESQRDRGAGCEFCLAYCCTTHKFQGSECPVVIVVADAAAGFVASREWHYTAISRAKKLCVLVGQKEVVERQCKRVAIRDRKTFLVELVGEGMKKGLTAMEPSVEER